MSHSPYSMTPGAISIPPVGSASQLAANALPPLRRTRTRNAVKKNMNSLPMSLLESVIEHIVYCYLVCLCSSGKLG